MIRLMSLRTHVSRRISELEYRVAVNLRLKFSDLSFPQLTLLFCGNFDCLCRIYSKIWIFHRSLGPRRVAIEHYELFEPTRKRVYINFSQARFFFLKLKLYSFCRNAAISSAEMTRITAKRIKTLLRGGAVRKRFAVYTCATTPRRLNANVRLIKLHFAAGGFRVGGAWPDYGMPPRQSSRWQTISRIDLHTGLTGRDVIAREIRFLGTCAQTHERLCAHEFAQSI